MSTIYENECRQSAMPILRNISVPTGNILVVQGEHGKLELLSIGDYGKEVNLNRDSVVSDNLPLIPLERKWVITISTQYGCSMGCTFCDVPKVGKGVNATLTDMQRQVIAGLQLHPTVTWSNRLNIHYARMGEPTFNPAVLDHARWLKAHIDPEYCVHPVVTTMCPRNNEWLKTFLHAWVRIKNRVYLGNAGLQLSINSTDEEVRERIFRKSALPLWKIAHLLEGCVPVGRKFTLNFAVCEWPIDPEVLLRYFDPDRFLVKLTPMHETKAAQSHGHRTDGDYTNPQSYREIKFKLERAGYEVLVFVTSTDEDLSRITCGNAVLGETTAQPERIRVEPLRFTDEVVTRAYHVV
jgi:23S rRNA (adenine2503-C2)-methyltransferase